MRVLTNKECFINNQRRRAGEIFEVPNDMKLPEWMVRADVEVARPAPQPKRPDEK